MPKLFLLPKVVFAILLLVCYRDASAFGNSGCFFIKSLCYDSIPLKSYDVEGWQFFDEPYVKKINSDSVAIEIVLVHANNLKWNAEQLVGYISTASEKPLRERNYTFYLLNENIWNIRIASNGQFYIKLIKGDPPTTDPVVLPIKTYFNIK